MGYGYKIGITVSYTTLFADGSKQKNEAPSSEMTDSLFNRSIYIWTFIYIIFVTYNGEELYSRASPLGQKQ